MIWLYSLHITRSGDTTNKPPNGKILKDMGKSTGTASVNVEPKEKHMRSSGFGGGMICNDDFINDGLRPEIFKNQPISFSVELLYNYP